MALEYLTSSLPLMALILAGLAYADYALTILGQKLYVERGREFQVNEAYELNPVWRETVAQGRYWHPRLLKLVAVSVAIAGLLWVMGWLGRQAFAGSGAASLMEQLTSGFCEAILAMLISMYLLVMSMHLRNVHIFSRLMRPELVQGQLRVSAAFSYAQARQAALLAAIPLLALACLQPSAGTVGFALGPLLLGLKIRQMESRNGRLPEAQQPEEIVPDATTEA